MALTKAATTLASGVTTDTTTSAVDVSDAYRATVYYSMVQVAAATTGASMDVEVRPSAAGSYYVLTSIQFPAAAGTYQGAIELPDDIQDVRLDFVAQSGGTSSTLDAEVGEVTAL